MITTAIRVPRPAASSTTWTTSCTGASPLKNTTTTTESSSDRTICNKAPAGSPQASAKVKRKPRSSSAGRENRFSAATTAMVASDWAEPKTAKASKGVIPPESTGRAATSEAPMPVTKAATP